MITLPIAVNYGIIALMLISGTAYFSFREIGKIKKRNTLLPPKEVVKTFFISEWDSLGVAILGWMVFIALYTVLYFSGIKANPAWFWGYGVLAPFLVALLWGYASHRLAYSILGTAERVVEEKQKVMLASGNYLKKDE